MFSGLFSKAKNALKEVLDDEQKFNGYMDKFFDKIDSDQSGFIEKEEVETLIKTIALKFKKDFEVPEEKIITVLESIDKDGDGKISKEEFRTTSRLKLLSLVNSE
jgi:Ca2+-binding EF-hand superfamily protein